MSLKNISMCKFNMDIKKLKKGSSISIEKFIKEIDPEIVPPIGTKVDLGKWAIKLDTFAINLASLDQLGNIEALLSFYVNKGSFITFFAVSKDHRRRGLGSMLLDACIHECKKEQSSSIKVHTWLSNERAIILYNSKGFKKDEIRTDRLVDTTLILKKKL